MHDTSSEESNSNLFNEAAGYIAKLTGVGIAVGGLHYGFSGMEEAGTSLSYAAAAIFATSVYDCIKQGLKRDDNLTTEAPIQYGAIYEVINDSSPSLK